MGISVVKSRVIDETNSQFSRRIAYVASTTLYSNIYHQGTVYEATAYAVPFLIELLNEPDILCKAEILVLLAHLADGYSFIEQHQHFEFTFTQEERTSPELAERLRQEQSWVK